MNSTNNITCEYTFTQGKYLNQKCKVKKIFCNGLCVKHHKAEQIKKDNIDKIKNKNINNIKKQLNIIIKKYDIDIIELRNIINLMEEDEEEEDEEEVVEEEEDEEEDEENIIIKKNILDLPIDILENLIIQNISKKLNIIFNNKIEKYIKYNGSDYYTTFECEGKHCEETHKLKLGYGWWRRWNDDVSLNTPFKIQLLCGSCIKQQEIECGRCKKDFNIKKMNYFLYDCNKDNFYDDFNDRNNIKCNRCIKHQIENFSTSLKFSIKKYDDIIQYKSLKYRLIDEQIKWKNRCII